MTTFTNKLTHSVRLARSPPPCSIKNAPRFARRRFILSSMNNTCNFLSDPTLDVDQIDELFESLFISTQDSGDGAESFGYFDNINLLAEHPIFDAFLRSAELPER